ncbi:pseudaminic acid synthase [Nitrincola alkalilacustris]|uniref:pseudaminic acid synthase n=1 Tax=Nitrincola alkalilacustris TaxID=1571224 RepID=UPI00124C10F4|nr:pseudaminic acid synthase [Nitrincola alkalilacustris]
MQINGVNIGPGYRPYIIAELSANHNGSLERALATIDMAKTRGADAVKIQTYTADTMTLDCDRDEFLIKGGLWDGYNLYQLYQEAQTPFEWHEALFEHARRLGITLFSTPFDETAVDLLESLNAPAYKIASFEAVDLPLIRYVAATGKPMIISTGMADVEEIGEAVTAAREGGCRDLVLLHCISGYPTPMEQANLHTLVDMSRRFGVPVGLSDHTLGTVASVAAVALGACVIEKHVTLSRQDPGPDAAFSLEPEELERLCRDSRLAWEALGKAGYDRRDAEQTNLQYRRSVYFVKDMAIGEIIAEEHIRRIRPGLGLPPRDYEALLGRRVSCNITRGTPVRWELLMEDKS